MTPIDFVTSESIIRFHVTEPHRVWCVFRNIRIDVWKPCLRTSVAHLCFWAILYSLFAQISKLAANLNRCEFDEGAAAFSVPTGDLHASWGQDEIWLWHSPRQTLPLCQKPARALQLFKGFTQDRGWHWMDCSQQKGKFLLFLSFFLKKIQAIRPLRRNLRHVLENWWTLITLKKLSFKSNLCKTRSALIKG